MHNRLLRLALASATAGFLAAAAPAASATAAVNVSAPVTGVASLNSVACPTATACVAVGSDSSLNGKSAVITAATGAVKAWPGTLTSETPRAVTCRVTATTCLAVADDAVITVKVVGGAMKVTAKPKPPAGGIVALGALACASAANCYAVGFQGLPGSSTAVVAHLSGAGKLLGKTAEPGTGMGAIACTSSTRCLISDSEAGLTSIRLLNSGRLGTSHAFPAQTYVQALSCYKASLCYALGGNSSVTPSVTDELFPLNPATGAIGSMTTIAGLNGTSLGCISSSRCLVAGFTGSGSTAQAGVVVVTGGKPATPKNYPGSAFSAIACATASRCYAVGSDSSGAFVDKVAS